MKGFVSTWLRLIKWWLISRDFGDLNTIPTSSKPKIKGRKYSTQFINITLSMVKKTSVTQISPGSSEGKGGKQDLARPSLELAKIFTRYGWKTNKEDYWIWNICRFFVILQKQTIQAVQCSVHNRCLQEDMLSKRTGLICAMIWIKVT